MTPKAEPKSEPKEPTPDQSYAEWLEQQSVEGASPVPEETEKGDE